MGAVRRPSAAVFAALLAFGAACGAPDDTTAPLAAPGDSTTTTEPTTTETPTAETTSTTTATTVATTTTLPGEPYDEVAGTVAFVWNVAFDETFDLQSLPGEGQPSVGSFPPLTELVFTGAGRLVQVPDDTYTVPWVEVTAGGITGWISRWKLAFLGVSRDLTADVVATLGAAPTAPTMLELGRIVTDVLVPSQPDSLPRIVIVGAPTDGTTSVVVIDGLPGEAFGDDTAVGSRYVVTGREGPTGQLPATGFASGVEYELVSVTARSLCTRGVDAASGFCV